MWLYGFLLNETVLLKPNLCLQHLAFPKYEFLKVAGLQFGCDSSKIIKFDCFWPFVVVKRQLGNVICAILLALMETNRLVPWLRQSDHPIQKYHVDNPCTMYKFIVCTYMIMYTLHNVLNLHLVLSGQQHYRQEVWSSLFKKSRLRVHFGGHWALILDF